MAKSKKDKKRRKGINGRAKGNSFERRVAALVVKAFSSFGITKTDCYRTPLSGGHRFASKVDPGDLVMTKKLRKLFPFHVECKHYRKVELFPLWLMGSKAYKKAWKFRSWIKQASTASEGQAKKFSMAPMVVFKGNGSAPIMCLYPATAAQVHPSIRLVFKYEGEKWYATTFAEFLRVRVKDVCKQ